MVKHLLASMTLAAGLGVTPALATHDHPNPQDLPGQSGFAPGQMAQDSDQSARFYAPGQWAKDTDQPARNFAPGRQGRTGLGAAGTANGPFRSPGRGNRRGN